ncbi:MAG: vitamin B12 dependent-methionine synthase activation domain-containing protein [Pseudomonadota bacterium]
MNPPFFGTKILDGITLDDIEPLIDREALFAGRWQFRQGMGPEEWEKLKQERAIPTFERLLSVCRAKSIIRPMAVYGYFECRQQGNGLIVTDGARSFRFDFPRERQEPHRCLADFFPEGFVAMQLVTAGGKVTEAGADLFARHEYSEMFFLKGLAAAAAAAAAAFCHRLIREELGAGADAGERFSPGYPVFPDILDQKKIAALLKPGRIGVSLTKTCQMVPEYSTSAIVSVDSKAAHFRP